MTVALDQQAVLLRHVIAVRLRAFLNDKARGAVLESSELEALTFLQTDSDRALSEAEDLVALAGPDLDAYVSAGRYYAIPLSIRAFLRALTCARTSASAARTFLEIGSGLGSKAIIMENVHPDIYYLGLELHPPYLAVARRVVPNQRFVQADALTFDRYAEFDLLYFYQPFRDRDQQLALEWTICNSARVGAVLIRVLGHADAGRSALPGWTRIGAFEDAADAMSSAWVSLWRKVGSV